jgi:hypothetical protein
MTFPVQQMTVEEYAEARRAIGDQVERRGRVYWSRSRCCFRRPLLLHEPLSLSPTEKPPVGLGGFEHVAASQRDANSTVSFLILDDLGSYGLNGLDHQRRRLIRNAARHFAVRPVTELAEFQEQGFQAYLSFYRRTHYAYHSERKRREHYRQWAKAVLDFPKSLVLGGYGPEGLTAISISYWVGDTLSYATFFSSTCALEKDIGELMFHALRETVGRQPGIRRIIVRRYQGGNGMDNYYLLRGARLVHEPACLCLNPFTGWLLKSFFPGRLALLQGGWNKRNADGRTK